MAKKVLPEEFFDEKIQQVGWIDVHTHLNFLEIEPEEAIRQALDKSVNRIITIGTEPKDLPVVLGLADTWAPHVFCTLGIHPHEGKLYTDEVENYLRTHLSKPRVVAVGEIGLDYYYNNSSREEQLNAFRRQMQLAEEFQMPVEIHTRDADDDTIQVLQEFQGRVRGIIHCFTGTQRLADAALDCGYNISFSGVVTFKKAEELREICKKVPVDRMHVETDAPFLAPAPLRGQKNQPDFVLWTAKMVAEIKNIPLYDFCVQMRENANKMFPKLMS